MYFSFDKFNRYEIPEMVLCNPNFDELDVIVPSAAFKIIPRFNAISELSFEINSGDDVPYFNLITKNRVIHVDGFGYWVIDSAPVESEGFIERKSVHCFSYEYTLTMRNADIKAGTYNFYDITSPDDTLMGTIQRRCPSWKIGKNISNELIGKYRTFDMPDTTVYNFLTQEASEAYEAIFVFDNENLEINAYTASEVITPTDIVFTWDNLMKSVEIAETDDPVITALDIYGAGNLSIASINPLGTATIYRFDYFAEQMTPALWTKVKAWQDEIDEQIQAGDDDADGTSYRGLLARKLELSNKVIEVNSEIADGLAMLDSGKQVQDVSTPYTMAESSSNAVKDIKGWVDGLSYDQKRTMVLDATSYPVINLGFGVDETAVTLGVEEYAKNIVVDDGGIAEALVNIYLCEQFIAATTQNKNALMQEIAELDTAISAKNESLSMAAYFTQEELLELDKFIFGTTYTNEYFVLSENYTFADMQEVARQLYEQGKNALTRISQPNYNFSLEAMNFLFMKEYEHFTLQCKLGCTVNAEIREDEWVSPVLLEMEIDYGNPDNFSMTWGNRYRLQTAEWTWAELNNEVSKTSGVVSANFSDMIKPVRNGDLDKFAEFMNSALDTSRNAVLAGNNQSMLIDSHGILGRKEKEGTVNEYEPEQIKVLNNGIYLTDDNWLNCAMAMGKVTVGGIDKFGVIADVLVGSMLIGNNLSIMSESGNFSVDGGGMSFENVSENAKIFMNPSQGFHMQANEDGKWVDKIAMDMATGSVTIAGALTSVGNIAGWENKEESGLQRILGNQVCAAEVKYYSDPECTTEVGATEAVTNIVEVVSDMSAAIEMVDEEGITTRYYVPISSVYDSADNGFARLGGGQYAFSAGDSQVTPSFSVDYNGNLIASKGTFRGNVIASSGSLGAFSANEDGASITGSLKVTGSFQGNITPANAGITDTATRLVTSNGSKFGVMPYSTLAVKTDDGFSGTLVLYGTPSFDSGGGSSGGVTYDLIKKDSVTTVRVRSDHSTSAPYHANVSNNVWYVVIGAYSSEWFQVAGTATVTSSGNNPGSIKAIVKTDESTGWVHLDPSLDTVTYVTNIPYVG